MTDIPRIAVIGAGLAGLSCASLLQETGLSVTVFEKSRGPGGRMGTRSTEDWQCDHGAQYFTARHPDFQAEVRRWQYEGVAALWTPRMAVLGDAGGHRLDPALERYVGIPGMTAPARWLARGLDVHLSTHIQRIEAARRESEHSSPTTTFMRRVARRQQQGRDPRAFRRLAMAAAVTHSVVYGAYQPARR